MTDKKVILTLNLMPSEQLVTLIRWLKELCYIIIYT